MKSEALYKGKNLDWRIVIFSGVIIGLFHLILASVYIDHPPQYDEMYHMLAAESWRETGELRILDGEYTRAAGFTKLVALQSYVCGPSLECARSLSLIASAMLVFSVIIFSSIMMSFPVGIVAGLLVALNPAVVISSQMVRFYSLHALIFFLLAIILIILLTRWKEESLWVSLSLATVALVLLYLANHLQATTQIGLMGLAVATFVLKASILFKWFRLKSIAIRCLLGAGIVVFIIIGLLLINVGEKIEMLRWTPGWAEGTKNNYLYYHYLMKNWYPTLWSLAAFFAILSIARWPMLSFFFLITFLICFALFSIAGMKASRLIMFSLPFFFIPLAGGMVVAFNIMVGFVSNSLKNSPALSNNQFWVQLLAVAIVSLATLGYLTTQPLVRSAWRIASKPGYETIYGGYEEYADWPVASDTLRSLMKDYPTVVSSSGVKAAWFLGNFDFELNHSVMLETDTANEFGTDPRTGRPVISSPESVKRIVEKHKTLLVVVEDRDANNQRQVSNEVVQLLDLVGTRFDIKARNLIVWVIKSSSNIQEID